VRHRGVTTWHEAVIDLDPELLQEAAVVAGHSLLHNERLPRRFLKSNDVKIRSSKLTHFHI
jgi:hypothetical protein